MYIPRAIEGQIKERLAFSPVVALLGPRQVGKTTVALKIKEDLTAVSLYFDLESRNDAAKFSSDPVLFLQSLKDTTVILDEIHRLPDIFLDMRGLIDADPRPGRFILLGSAAPELLKNTSESLAGRISYLELTPFLFREINENYQQHWFRGGFPKSFLADTDQIQQIWFDDFIRTYVEKDLVAMGLNASPLLMRRLITMVANMQGGLLTLSALSDSLGVRASVIGSYLDFLEHAFLVRRLLPYYKNLNKRLVKSSKIFVRDSGLLHFLLRISDLSALYGHPIAGASWEGYIIEEIIASLPHYQLPFFFRTADGAELDLVIEEAGQIKLAVEIKLTNAPSISKGNTLALQYLDNPHLVIVTPSADDYLFRKNVSVCSINTLWAVLREKGIGI